VQYPCADCYGMGGSDASVCFQCKGSTIDLVGNNCAVCRLTGVSFKIRCTTCAGRAYRPHTNRVWLAFPAARGPHTIVVPGMGMRGTRREPGDLHVRFLVCPSVDEKQFRLEADGTLHVEHSIGLREALLGGVVMVPHPSGPLPVTLSGVTQPGGSTTMPGWGLENAPFVVRWRVVLEAPSEGLRAALA
jgi:DnaJ-class molecular chaperone